jgi:hypothetical protein
MALIHAEAVYGGAFKTKYPQAFSTAVIPHADAAVGRGGGQNMPRMLQSVEMGARKQDDENVRGTNV